MSLLPETVSDSVISALVSPLVISRITGSFVSIHRHRSTLVSFRIDLPTSNQHGDSHFVLSAM